MKNLLTFSTGTTYYNILVTIGSVNWTVRHRYKEFVDLHSKLVNGQSIGRDLLPPKKVNIETLSLGFCHTKTIFVLISNYFFAGHWKSIASIS